MIVTQTEIYVGKLFNLITLNAVSATNQQSNNLTIQSKSCRTGEISRIHCGVPTIFIIIL